MRKRGRQTKLTPETQAIIVKQLELGNYIETSALLADVSKVALYDWLKKGKKQKSGMYRDFLNAVYRAQAVAEDRDLHVIDRAAQGINEVVTKEVYERNKAGELVLVEKRVEKKKTTDWKASAWRLERRRPGQFGKKTAIDVTTTTLNKEQTDAIAKLQD